MSETNSTKEPVKVYGANADGRQIVTGMPVIHMENIIKRYYEGKPNELQILNGISLDVHANEFVSIVGESGSGKSTIMNIIGILDRQSEGNY